MTPVLSGLPALGITIALLLPLVLGVAAALREACTCKVMATAALEERSATLMTLKVVGAVADIAAGVRL